MGGSIGVSIFFVGSASNWIGIMKNKIKNPEFLSMALLGNCVSLIFSNQFKFGAAILLIETRSELWYLWSALASSFNLEAVWIESFFN